MVKTWHPFKGAQQLVFNSLAAVEDGTAYKRAGDEVTGGAGFRFDHASPAYAGHAVNMGLLHCLKLQQQEQSQPLQNNKRKTEIRFINMQVV